MAFNLPNLAQAIAAGAQLRQAKESANARAAQGLANVGMGIGNLLQNIPRLRQQKQAGDIAERGIGLEERKQDVVELEKNYNPEFLKQARAGVIPYSDVIFNRDVNRGNREWDEDQRAIKLREDFNRQTLEFQRKQKEMSYEEKQRFWVDRRDQLSTYYTSAGYTPEEAQEKANALVTDNLDLIQRDLRAGVHTKEAGVAQTQEQTKTLEAQRKFTQAQTDFFEAKSPIALQTMEQELMRLNETRAFEEEKMDFEREWMRVRGANMEEEYFTGLEQKHIQNDKLRSSIAQGWKALEQNNRKLQFEAHRLWKQGRLGAITNKMRARETAVRAYGQAVERWSEQIMMNKALADAEGTDPEIAKDLRETNARLRALIENPEEGISTMMGDTSYLDLFILAEDPSKQEAPRGDVPGRDVPGPGSE